MILCVLSTLNATLRNNSGNMSENKILVGKIVGAQGLRGEVRVQTYTQNPSDFAILPILLDGFEFVRALPNSSVIIARIKDTGDRTAAENLRGTKLFVDRGALPAPTDGEYYIADLIGMRIAPHEGLSAKRTGGVVVAVHNFGAGDILELDNGEMVSFAGATVDFEKKVIHI